MTSPPAPPHVAAAASSSSDSVTTEHHVHRLTFTNVRRLSDFHRFGLLSLSSFAMICASTSYAFNLFSESLRSQYDYDSRQMSSINTVGMVFAYFLLPYGYIYDYLGPLPVYCLACVLAPLGLLLMGLTFQGIITGSVVRFCVFNALLSLGSQLFDLATVVTMLSVFPTQKGWVVALLKTLMGLGSAIIGSVRSGFFLTTPANYFYFLVGLVVVVGIACMVFVRLPAYHLTGYEQSHLSEEEKAVRETDRVAYLTQEPPMWRFYFGIILILVLVVYLPTTSAVGAFTSVGTTKDGLLIFAVVAVILSCCFLLILVPCPWIDRATTHRSNQLQPSSTMGDVDRTATAKMEAGDERTGEIPVVKESHVPVGAATPKYLTTQTDLDFIAPAYQTTFWQSCRTVSLWCILWTMFCGVGSEFVIIFNATPIFSALTGTPQLDLTVSVLLTVLNGAGSAIGRLLMSGFEAYTQKRKAEDRIPITFAFFVPTSLIIISLVLFLILPGRALLLAFAIAALGNGFCASITILVLRTLYAKDPAKHYNFGFNALWIAAILLNRLLYGEWIASRADKQGSKVCLGRDCVLMPMLVMICLNVTAALSDVYVHICYTRFSRRVLEERRRMREEDEAAAAAELSSEPF